MLFLECPELLTIELLTIELTIEWTATPEQCFWEEVFWIPFFFFFINKSICRQMPDIRTEQNALHLLLFFYYCIMRALLKNSV